MISEVFGSFWAFAYLAFTIAMVVVVLVRKREPSAALGWSLAIVLLPILGSVLFVVFGVSKLPRRLRRKVEHRTAYREAADPAAAPSRAALERAGHLMPGQNLLDALGEPPPTRGNAVEFFADGPAAFERMFTAIAEARHHVHVEMYIFRNDELGKRLMALLRERSEAGVEVRLIVDSMGTFGGWRLLRSLRRAGGEGAVFLPLLAVGQRFAPNLRNHRKVVVCDGRVAYFGGLNVGEEYLGRKRDGREWCDLHVEVRGPAVRDVQAIFAEDWDFCTGKRLEGDAYFPSADAAGDAPLRIVSGGPDREVNPIREAYFYALTHAKRRLWIASPYIVPDAALRNALESAARTGVDVRLITQELPPDNRLAELAGSYYFEELLDAGIRLFRYEPGMMHAKVVLVDDALAAVGSANLDNRSLGLNFELVGIFGGAAEVESVAGCLDRMLARSREIDHGTLAERTALRRVGESLARLLSPLL